MPQKVRVDEMLVMDSQLSRRSRRNWQCGGSHTRAPWCHCQHPDGTSPMPCHALSDCVLPSPCTPRPSAPPCPSPTLRTLDCLPPSGTPRPSAHPLCPPQPPHAPLPTPSIPRPSANSKHPTLLCSPHPVRRSSHTHTASGARDARARRGRPCPWSLRGTLSSSTTSRSCWR